MTGKDSEGESEQQIAVKPIHHHQLYALYISESVQATFTEEVQAYANPFIFKLITKVHLSK